jgi:hypothetical protein
MTDDNQTHSLRSSKGEYPSEEYFADRGKIRLLVPEGGVLIFNSIEERDATLNKLKIEKPHLYQQIIDYQTNNASFINEFNTLADFVRNEIGLDL